MEVICISNIDGTVADFKGNVILDDNSPNPIKGEIYIVYAIRKFEDGDYYKLKGFDYLDYFHSRHFEKTDSIQNEINSALKAKNPNIKKFSLHELDSIGYYVPGYSDNENAKEWVKRLGLC